MILLENHFGYVVLFVITHSVVDLVNKVVLRNKGVSGKN